MDKKKKKTDLNVFLQNVFVCFNFYSSLRHLIENHKISFL